MELDSAQKNKELEAAWTVRENETKKKEAEVERFRQAQNEKGLRLYKGEWLPIQDVFKMEQADRNDAFYIEQANRRLRGQGHPYIEKSNSFDIGPAATPTSNFDKKKFKTIRVIHSR